MRNIWPMIVGAVVVAGAGVTLYNATGGKEPASTPPAVAIPTPTPTQETATAPTALPNYWPRGVTPRVTTVGQGRRNGPGKPERAVSEMMNSVPRAHQPALDRSAGHTLYIVVRRKKCVISGP